MLLAEVANRAAQCKQCGKEQRNGGKGMWNGTDRTGNGVVARDMQMAAGKIARNSIASEAVL